MNSSAPPAARLEDCEVKALSPDTVCLSPKMPEPRAGLSGIRDKHGAVGRADKGAAGSSQSSGMALRCLQCFGERRALASASAAGRWFA